MANFKSVRLALVWLGTGIGVAVLGGFVANQLAPTRPAFASATHGTENLTAATGLLDSGAEAIVYLDHVTGELTGYVLSTTTWAVVGNYHHPRVSQDLQLANVKNPKYTLVTGATAFKPKGANRLGSCVVYVAEETTGMMVAYGMPWDTGSMTRTTPINRPFVKLAGPLKVSSAVRRGGGGEVGVEEVKDPPPKKGKKEK